MIGSEAPDIIGLGAQAQEEVGRLALPHSVAFSRFLPPRMDGLTFAENVGLPGTELRNALNLQRITGLVHLIGKPKKSPINAAVRCTGIMSEGVK